MEEPGLLHVVLQADTGLLDDNPGQRSIACMPWTADVHLRRLYRQSRGLLRFEDPGFGLDRSSLAGSGHAPGPSHAPDHYHTNPCGLRNLFWCRESRRTRGEQPRRTAAAAGSKPPDRPGQRNSIRQRAGRGETPGTGQVPFLLASSWDPTRHLCGLAAVVTVGCFGHVKVPGAGTLIRAACLLLVGMSRPNQGVRGGHTVLSGVHASW